MPRKTAVDESSQQGLREIINYNKERYYLYTSTSSFGRDGVELYLTDDDNSWYCKLNGTDMKKLHQQQSGDRDDYESYCRKTIDTLCGVQQRTEKKRGGSGHVEFSVLVRGNNCEVAWKMVSGDVKVKLGSASFHKCDSFPTRTVYKYAISTIADQQREIQDLTADNDRLVDERQTAVKKLEKQVSEKEKYEADLYRKFAAVINSKKSKIRELKSYVESESSLATQPTQKTEPSGPTAHTSKASTSRVIKRDLSTSASDYETDGEEEQPKTSSSKSSKIVKLGNDNDDDDDGLFLGEDNPSTKTAPVGRRKRKVVKAKKTPSKPVIPKVSSTDKDKTPKRGSLRRSSSQQRNSTASSAESIEDLIDKM